MTSTIERHSAPAIRPGHFRVGLEALSAFRPDVHLLVILRGSPNSRCDDAGCSPWPSQYSRIDQVHVEPEAAAVPVGCDAASSGGHPQAAGARGMACEPPPGRGGGAVGVHLQRASAGRIKLDPRPPKTSRKIIPNDVYFQTNPSLYSNGTQERGSRGRTGTDGT